MFTYPSHPYFPKIDGPEAHHSSLRFHVTYYFLKIKRSLPLLTIENYFTNFYFYELSFPVFIHLYSSRFFSVLPYPTFYVHMQLAFQFCPVALPLRSNPTLHHQLISSFPFHRSSIPHDPSSMDASSRNRMPAPTSQPNQRQHATNLQSNVGTPRLLAKSMVELTNLP